MAKTECLDLLSQTRSDSITIYCYLFYVGLLKGITEHRLHRSIDSITHGALMDFVTTGETKHLIAKKALIPLKEPDYGAAFLSIQDEAFKARGLRATNMRQIAKVDALYTLSDSVLMLLKIAWRQKGKVRLKAMDILKKHGYGFDPEKDFTEEWNRLVNEWEALKNTIALEEAKIEKSKPLTKEDYLREWDAMEDAKTRSLNPYSITEAKWIQMINREKEKAKARKQSAA